MKSANCISAIGRRPINAAPIAANESDYFVRMWNQAADAMTAYQAQTAINTVFEPILPMTPIVMPGVGESAAAAAVGLDAGLIPEQHGETHHRPLARQQPA